MFNDLKLGIIGFGNMGGAIATGLIRQKALDGSQIYACAKNWDKLCKNTQEKGIHPCKTAKEVVDNADMVIIAVKPYMIEEVITPLKQELLHKTVISIAANFPFAKYEEILLPGTHHLSTVPNTPVSIGEGIFICENTHSLDEAELKLFTELFSTISVVQFVETNQLSIGGTVAGCGPAFASMFIEALADAGVMHGLSRSVAYRLASQMIVGTGKLQLETGNYPGAMKDAVCSPAGTTIVGVATLERKGFRSAVIDAIDAIEKK